MLYKECPGVIIETFGYCETPHENKPHSSILSEYSPKILQFDKESEGKKNGN
jgi:hypothetical protein